MEPGFQRSSQRIDREAFSQQLFARRGVPAQRFPRESVELSSDGQHGADTVRREIGALRKVLPEETIDILIAAALSGRAGIGEVDLEVGRGAERAMFGHLRALVPGQAATR